MQLLGILFGHVSACHTRTAATCPRHWDISGGPHWGQFILPEAVTSPQMCYVTY